jgi:hypothetical protein
MLSGLLGIQVVSYMSNITTDFVTTTKKIVSEVRSVLTTLHLIREDVKTIREQVVSNANEPAPSARTSDSRQQPQNADPTEWHILNQDQTNRKQETSDDKQRGKIYRCLHKWWKALKNPRFQVELAALIGLAYYACETTRTNNLTDTALQTSKTQFAESQKTTKEQFEVDQRPFIWLSKLEPEKIKAGEKIQWSYWLTNYGKTPAVNAHIVAKVQFGENANVAPNWVFENGSPGNVLPQGVPPPPSKGTLYSTSYSDNIVNDPSTLNIDAGYYIFIHVEYNGLDRRTTYTSNICFFHLKTGATAACRGYNEIK